MMKRKGRWLRAALLAGSLLFAAECGALAATIPRDVVAGRVISTSSAQRTIAVTDIHGVSGTVRLAAGTSILAERTVKASKLAVGDRVLIGAGDTGLSNPPDPSASGYHLATGKVIKTKPITVSTDGSAVRAITLKKSRAVRKLVSKTLGSIVAGQQILATGVIGGNDTIDAVEIVLDAPLPAVDDTPAPDTIPPDGYGPPASPATNNNSSAPSASRRSRSAYQNYSAQKSQAGTNDQSADDNGPPDGDPPGRGPGGGEFGGGPGGGGPPGG